jgi:hypothetical protein
MDAALRTGLWNVLYKFVLGPMHDYTWLNQTTLRPIIQRIWAEHLKRAIDTIPSTTHLVVQQFRSHFFNCMWHEVYDFIEFIAQIFGESFTLMRATIYLANQNC